MPSENKILDVVKDSSKLNLFSSYFPGFGSSNTGSLFGQAASTGGTVFGQVNDVCLPPFVSTCVRPIHVVPTQRNQFELCVERQQTASHGSQALPSLAPLGTRKSQPLIRENHYNFEPPFFFDSPLGEHCKSTVREFYQSSACSARPGVDLQCVG